MRHRFANQQLTRAQFRKPADVVAWFGAVQAQDFAGAKWAVGQRVRGATDASVEQAFSDGAILRTHVMRPTWHFVAPADIRWLLALTAPRVKSLVDYYDRALGFDAATFKRSHAALARALRGGKQLTRGELGNALRQAGIDVKGQALGNLVMRAELDALICSGPRRGKQFTYMLLDERVPAARTLDRDEALTELTRRYFSSHGPATVKDFVWWSGLTAADARRGIDMHSPALAREVVNGKAYWFSPANPPAIPLTTYLLPNYDEYTVAYRERDAYYDPELGKGSGPRENLPFDHVIVTGGRVTGWWRRTYTRDAVVIRSRFAGRPSAREYQSFTTAAGRYGRFLKLPVVVT